MVLESNCLGAVVAHWSLLKGLGSLRQRELLCQKLRRPLCGSARNLEHEPRCRAETYKQTNASGQLKNLQLPAAAPPNIPKYRAKL